MAGTIGDVTKGREPRHKVGIAELDKACGKHAIGAGANRRGAVSRSFARRRRTCRAIDFTV